jgi:hypothetical protein
MKIGDEIKLTTNYSKIAKTKNVKIKKPKRKTGWVNIWKDSYGYFECTNIPYSSKADALNKRYINGNTLNYVCDPVEVSL